MSSQKNEAKSSHTARMIWNAGNSSVVERVEQTPRRVSKWRILVVENDPKTRGDYVHNLERWGYQVFAAAAEEEPKETLLENARKLAKQERCQLALVDMRLLSDDDDSDISGLNLVPDLKPTESIVVTGYADRPFYPRQATERGALAVFGKEERPEVLQKAVEDALADLGDPYPDLTALGEYATSHPWRVLVTGNDDRERSYYVDLLKNLGYQVCEASRRDAAQVAKKHRCHLVLVDADADAGVDSDVIQELRPAETIVIGRSPAFLALRETLSETIPTIHKRAGAERLCERIQAVLKNSGYRKIRIEWLPQLDAIRVVRHLFRGDPSQFKMEVEDVLLRLFLSADKLTLALGDFDGPPGHTPSLTLRPHSLVMQVTKDSDTLSSFVKLGRKDRTADEGNNFNRVRLKFGYPSLITLRERPVSSWTLGGVVYDYAGDFASYNPMIFRRYYETHDRPDEIRVVLEQFYRFWRPLYDHKEGTERLLQSYDRVWGGDKWRKKVLACADAGKQTDCPAPFRRLGLQDPIAWLIEKVQLRGDLEYGNSRTPIAKTAITHGDLHADNLFVFSTDKVEVCAIDFERTGRGTILQDWVELEHDILTRLVSLNSDEWLDFGRLVIEIAKPIEVTGKVGSKTPWPGQISHKKADKALAVIQKIRDLARETDGSSIVSAEQYVWGLLLNAVYRLVMWSEDYEEACEEVSQDPKAENLERKEAYLLAMQRCMVLAGMLCHRLDHWKDEQWPPKEWEAYLASPESDDDPNRNAPSIESPSSGWALLIGVGNTPSDPRSSLPTTVNDALALQPILVDPMTCAYPPENVRVLNNETATLSRILDELKRLADHTTANPDSTIIVYFSGHGGHLQADDRYFLVPSDIDPTDIEGSVLWASEFTERLRGIKAKRVLVLIDACHAAGMAAVKETSLLRASGFIEAPPPEGLLKSWQRSQPTGSTKQTTSAPPQGEGRAIISSSRGDQSSYIRKDSVLSIFTYHLLEALRGEANKPHDTSVSVSTLIGHLGRTVPASAERDWGVQQMPWTDLSGEDFSIVVLQTGGMVESKPARSPSNPILPTTQPSPDQPTHARKDITILHLSDIHLGTTSQAEVYYSQLETDLLHGLEHKQLDYLVLSGDIADKSTESDYQSAQFLVEQLIQRFKLKRNKIILVPGNHDVNYMLSKQAYSRFIHDPIPAADAGKRFIQQSVGRVVCDNEPLYQQRFANFARFYETICQQAYPLLESDQALVRAYASDKLLFLGLNSATEIDHHYESRARINMEALAKGLLKLTAKHDDWLKIAVWHHPIRGPEAMNADFVEQLTMRGFQACMYGHIHEAIEDYHKFDDRRGVRVIGVGTFGAPIRQQTPGIPLQYNLITLSPTDCTVEVQTRKKEKPEGAWSADARWGDKVRDPQPRYAFSVKWGLCSQATKKKG